MRQSGLTIVMENVHDPHNIYAAMRTCDAVGIQDIYVLNTELPRSGYFGIKVAAVPINGLLFTNMIK